MATTVRVVPHCPARYCSGRSRPPLAAPLPGHPMRFRSLLMFACMIIVPMIAMFSHKLPPELRNAMSRIVLNPALDLIESLALSAEAEEPDPAREFTGPPAGPLLADHAASGPPQPPRSIERAEMNTSTLQQQPPRPARQPLGLDRASALRQQLAEAGVRQLLIEPASDGSRSVRGSCRLAVDAEGQLQRLFHASGATETETLSQLAEQVGRWQQRLSTRTPSFGEQAFRR